MLRTAGIGRWVVRLQDLVRNCAVQHVAGDVPGKCIETQQHENGGGDRQSTNQSFHRCTLQSSSPTLSRNSGKEWTMTHAGCKGKRLEVVLVALLSSTFVLLMAVSTASSQSPYVGQEFREIKALSPQETSDYLSGNGMGLAKAAELNGYPGPAHVLQLAAQLDLTSEQKAKTEVLFKKMQARAIPLGKELVEEERTLDRLFASRSVDSESLGEVLARLGRLQGQVRQVHLDAHIEQTHLLTPAQVEKYNQLRGYGMTQEQETHQPRQH
jgi:Spy/CpxP family protein refolding chaperone